MGLLEEVWKDSVISFLILTFRYGQLDGTVHVISAPMNVGFTYVSYHASLKLSHALAVKKTQQPTTALALRSDDGVMEVDVPDRNEDYQVWLDRVRVVIDSLNMWIICLIH